MSLKEEAEKDLQTITYVAAGGAVIGCVAGGAAAAGPVGAVAGLTLGIAKGIAILLGGSFFS